MFGLEDDLNENAIVETWIKILKVTLDNRESSGSTIQFSLRTCWYGECILKKAVYLRLPACLKLKVQKN